MNQKSVKKHLLEELAHGKPVQKILNPEVPEGEPKPDLPDWNMVVQWLKDDEEFRAAYEHAMKYGAVYLADEMLVLKEKLLQDPKSAPAYKAAMDMIKWATMIRDPKYSERTIQEVKNSTPQDADTVMAKIRQLREELGFAASNIVDVTTVVLEEESLATKTRRANMAKARKALEDKRKGNESAGGM